MAFHYRASDRDVAKATRRLAEKRADHALTALAGGAPAAEALHSARKDAKKLRALLKLVGPALPGAKAENARLRDAARAVSALRDRGAMLEAFDRVAPGEVAAEFATIRAALETRAPARADEHALVAAFAATFEGLSASARDWTLREKGFDALEPGLTKGYARARAAMQAARHESTAEAFHEWRKRAKTHWFHAGLLAEIAPDLMAPHVALAEEVAERLGEQHDLVNLANLLPGLDVPKGDRKAFGKLVATERAALEHRALVNGARLHADSPKALAKRWRVWWELRGR